MLLPAKCCLLVAVEVGPSHHNDVMHQTRRCTYNSPRLEWISTSNDKCLIVDKHMQGEQMVMQERKWTTISVCVMYTS